MTWALLGIGLVLVIEGLALALAPSRIRQALEFLASLPPDRARQIGLAALAAGTVLVWLAQRMMA